MREIIIEIERIQLIRKRAKTRIFYCNACGKSGDFVSLREAAELFGIMESELFRFITNHDCHYQTTSEAKLHICVVSLLSEMSLRTNKEQFKIIGE